MGGSDGENTRRERGWTSDKETYEVIGGVGRRDGPATASPMGTVGEKAGATGAAGLFLDGRRVTTGGTRAAGEGAASSFIGGSGTSSGNMVTPTGGDGGGIEGKIMLSVFEDLVVSDVSDKWVRCQRTPHQVPVVFSIRQTPRMMIPAPHPLDLCLGMLIHDSVSVIIAYTAR